MRTSDFATSFNAVAAEYAAARPDYPPTLYDALEEAFGRSLAGAHGLDVGAGTGKATRGLSERGVQVTAVEPGAGMAGQLRTASPGVPLVRASGDALPFADASVDLVTYAQAWHWTRPEVALPEALRVLRHGGGLALWWNTNDRTVGWVDEQANRLRESLPQHGAHDITRIVGHHLTALEPALQPVYREVTWRRTVPLATHLANLATHSQFAVLDPEETRPVLAREEAIVGELFPDGLVEEPYVVRLTYLPRPVRLTSD
ncbi:methyltransferase domain-containing protein [Streptomyces sp. 3MP-14]|uniref:Methyltransferase domain-containing protein n=1 Tax=Streptomyces mimosae TaxID=2586635 RepID=A0A5N5ZSL9_9ACTN|nr:MULTISPECIES: class I SAM-dependent methyltransferase [Streptomyces]KAB8158853.1 methyltransferase domain-containing protein [Streptomyces mimosae]KAB8172755.1 methyltransferase domain-containing protein [Streptomyces sp. 3MP-14]